MGNMIAKSDQNNPDKKVADIFFQGFLVYIGNNKI